MYGVVVIIASFLLAAPAAIDFPARGINLLHNEKLALDEDGDGLPDGWGHPDVERIPGVRPSAFSWQQPREGRPGALVITGGEDLKGYWETFARGIEPGRKYRLEFLVYRPDFKQGVYPEVEIFGRRLKVDHHCLQRRYQRVFFHVQSGGIEGKTRVRFIVDQPGETFWFALPSLKALDGEPVPDPPINPAGGAEPFPIGIYGAEIAALKRIRDAGFTAVQSYSREPGFAADFLLACRRENLGCLITTPWRAEEVDGYLGRLEKLEPLRSDQTVWFYINDEPELRSIPPGRVAEVRKRLLRAYPGRRCALAMARSNRIPYYRHAAEIFMMDQYPIPGMPLTWLSDSIDEAVDLLGAKRVWAVIQAFGGGRYAARGWPRRPTREEMRALSFLAVAHGASGLFFFSYRDAASDPRAWEDLRAVLKDLRRVEAWLPVPNDPPNGRLKVEMRSAFRADARGRPAIHLGVKRRRLPWFRGSHSFPQRSEVLAVAVNVIDRPVAGRIRGWPKNTRAVTELLGEKVHPVVDGAVSIELPPYGVALLEGKTE